MRQIVVDTETTGLSPGDGHRIVELGAVEIVDGAITGRLFHTHLDPERDVAPDALMVHGLTQEFLTGKPHFEMVVDDFIAFIRDAELVIHNAAFDIGFLDAELKCAGRPRLSRLCSSIVDTLELARSLYPGQANNLDALCQRYQIDTGARKVHSALLDSQLLAELFIRMVPPSVKA